MFSAAYEPIKVMKCSQNC